jgi:mRNA interferase MazF
MVSPAFGAIVTAASGPYSSKPRPVLVVQNPLLTTGDSVVVIPFTSAPNDSITLRLAVEPTVANGLDRPCFLEIDKVSAIRADTLGAPVGHLDPAALVEVFQRLHLLLSPGNPNS